MSPEENLRPWSPAPLCPSCAANNHCHDLPQGACRRCDCLVRVGSGGGPESLPEHRGAEHTIEMTVMHLASLLAAQKAEIVGVDLFNRWWSVVMPDGRVWLETSNLAEALDAIDRYKKSDLTLHRSTTYSVTTGFVPVSTEEIATLRTKVKPRRRREDAFPRVMIAPEPGEPL